MEDPLKPLAYGGISLVIILYVYFFTIRKKQVNKKDPPIIDDSLKLRLEAKNRYHDIVIDLEEISREITAKLDNKITALNLLILEADKKIETLKKLTQNNKNFQSENKEGGFVSGNPQNKEEQGEKIKKLQAAGLNSNEIASKLNMMEGEVNLILSLIKKKME